jgi:hypothetical protein
MKNIDDGDPHNQAAKPNLACAPYIRGWDGYFDLAEHWMTAGSGRRIYKFRQWLELGSVPGDWVSRLDADFVAYMKEQTKGYICPECDSHV